MHSLATRHTDWSKRLPAKAAPLHITEKKLQLLYMISSALRIQFHERKIRPSLKPAHAPYHCQNFQKVLSEDFKSSVLPPHWAGRKPSATSTVQQEQPKQRMNVSNTAAPLFQKSGAKAGRRTNCLAHIQRPACLQPRAWCRRGGLPERCSPCCNEPGDRAAPPGSRPSLPGGQKPPCRSLPVLCRT